MEFQVKDNKALYIKSFYRRRDGDVASQSFSILGGRAYVLADSNPRRPIIIQKAGGCFNSLTFPFSPIR